MATLIHMRSAPMLGPSSHQRAQQVQSKPTRQTRHKHGGVMAGTQAHRTAPRAPRPVTLPATPATTTPTAVFPVMESPVMTRVTSSRAPRGSLVTVTTGSDRAAGVGAGARPGVGVAGAVVPRTKRLAPLDSAVVIAHTTRTPKVVTHRTHAPTALGPAAQAGRKRQQHPHNLGTSLSSTIHFHPYLSALKLTKTISKSVSKSVAGMAIPSSRTLARPKSRRQLKHHLVGGNGADKHHDGAVDTQPFPTHNHGEGIPPVPTLPAKLHKQQISYPQHLRRPQSQDTQAMLYTESRPQTATLPSLTPPRRKKVPKYLPSPPQQLHAASPTRPFHYDDDMDDGSPRDHDEGSPSIPVEHSGDYDQSFATTNTTMDTYNHIDTVSFCTDHETTPAHTPARPRPASGASYARITKDELNHPEYYVPSPLSSPSRNRNHQNTDPAAPSFNSKAVYSLTDGELAERFHFSQEIGSGNWGSVWMCKLRDTRLTPHRGDSDSGVLTLGRAAALSGGMGAKGRVAVKLVCRQRDEQTVAQRVKALWGEMRIIHHLRTEPHPSVIQFEAFVITPSYALVVMPYLDKIIPVTQEVDEARPYFRQLCSAVAYLHERGITHNDIKPANIVMSFNDIPVLVDFGFAIRHTESGPSRFLSRTNWGTPEYLEPHRAKGFPHDERESDVWSLGVTFYEILVGRTPFEADFDEPFDTPEALQMYWDRSCAGKWLGDYDMPEDMEHLLKFMINPDPRTRIQAIQAYHHPALHPPKQAFITPPVVREAYEDDPVFHRAVTPVTPLPQVHHHKLKAVKSDIGVRPKKNGPGTVAQPLGDSIKQATSVDHLRPAKKLVAVRAKVVTPPAKVAIARRVAMTPVQDENEDPSALGTPTRTVQSVLQPRVQALAQEGMPRVSPSQTRPSSAPGTLASRPPLRRTSLRVSRHIRPPTSPERHHNTDVNNNQDEIMPRPTSPVRTRDEALLRTMRSLEGAKRDGAKHGDVRHGIVIRSPSNSPSKLKESRAQSFDAVTEQRERERQQDRRTWGMNERLAALADVAEEVSTKVSSGSQHRDNGNRAGTALPGASRSNGQIVVTTRPHTPHTPPPFGTQPPVLDVNISTESVFSPSFRGRITSGDSSRIRSAELHPGSAHTHSPARKGELTPVRKAKQSTAPSEIAAPETAATPALDGLDRLADWAKDIERYVEEAKQALAAGREAPQPPAMPEDLDSLTAYARPMSPSPVYPAKVQGPRRIPLQPEQPQPVARVPLAVPTPVQPQPKREVIRESSHDYPARPTSGLGMRTMSQVFKRFHHDKDPRRPMSPDPAKALRGTPSVPAMRAAGGKRVPSRKSESNLRSTDDIITDEARRSALHAQRKAAEFIRREEDMAGHQASASAAHAATEEKLTSASRRGTSASRPSTANTLDAPRMGKPSSMVSLRDKARALISGPGGDDKNEKRDKYDKHATLPRNSRLNGAYATHSGGYSNASASGTSATNTSASGTRSSQTLPHRSSHRPDTPAASSVFSGFSSKPERKSIFKIFGARNRK